MTVMRSAYEPERRQDRLRAGTNALGAAGLALAVLSQDEENNQGRREDGHGCDEDRHFPYLFLYGMISPER